MEKLNRVIRIIGIDELIRYKRMEAESEIIIIIFSFACLTQKGIDYKSIQVVRKFFNDHAGNDHLDDLMKNKFDIRCHIFNKMYPNGIKGISGCLSIIKNASYLDFINWRNSILKKHKDE